MTQRIAIQRMLHTIHAVRDVHAARKLYQDVFGAIAFAERYHAGEDRNMALLYAANHMIEPMAPRNPENPDTVFARYLAKFGESLHSFELRIDDAAADLCRDRGLALSTVYPKFFFVKPQSTGGIVVELCGKPLENDPQDYRGWRPDWIDGHPSSLRRLHHIVCVVRDMDAALRFFLDTLAGELLADERVVLPQPGRQVRLLLGDTRLALIIADDPARGPIGAYMSRPASGIFALMWEVGDLDAVRGHMAHIGMPTAAPLLWAEGVALDPAAMLGARHEFIVPH
jgi:hypothetical protein